MILIERTTPQRIRMQRQRFPGKYGVSKTNSAEPEQTKIMSHFNDFMSKLLSSDIQNRTAYDIADQLIRISPTFNIKFEIAKQENEILFIVQNEKAQNIIVLDEDGDIMISHSPSSGRGWREFVDNSKLDFESIVYKFLSM